MEARLQQPIRHRDRSLAWYLAALMGILAVPLLALSVIPTWMHLATERGRLETIAGAAREDVLSLLDRDHAAKVAILRALATSPALDAGDFERFESQARELIGTEGFHIILRDSTGRQLINTSIPRGATLPEKPNAIGDATIVQARQPFISNLFFGPTSEEFLTVVAVPVVRGGEVTHSLSAVLTSRYVTSLLTQIWPAAPYYAVVADREGVIIANSVDDHRFVGDVLPGFREIALPEGSWSGRDLSGVAIQRIHRRSSLSGWIVAIAVPQAALTASFHRSLALVLALVAAVAAVAVACGIFLCRRLTRVFRSLCLAAERIGDGAIVTLPRSSLREADQIGRVLEEASRKLTEDADTLKRTNEDLERRVEERTSLLRSAKELAESARARAETANEAKSQFLSSMSHELRTPLTAISGFAQILHGYEGLPAQRQQRYALNIKDASDLLMSIVDDVLDLARIESGRIDLEVQPLDSLEIMSEVHRTLEPLANARRLILTVDTSVSVPLVLADRGRLKQVLLNLGSNALKYNVDDGWVLLLAHPTTDGMVRFIVRDTGRGIPAERHAEVFTPFSRLGAEQGAEEGTGIGLAICRELVHAMGGEIGFESSPGTGSTFWFDIPVARDSAVAASGRASLLEATTDIGRSTILYIEDKILNIEVMRGIIENTESLRVVEAQTVHEGLAIARRLKPDIVITDIHLPDGKGFEVLQHLREDGETAHIPVIALTADAMPTNMHNMQRAGFDHIVTKPFDVPEFVSIVRSTLRPAA